MESIDSAGGSVGWHYGGVNGGYKYGGQNMCMDGVRPATVRLNDLRGGREKGGEGGGEKKEAICKWVTTQHSLTLTTQRR